MTIRRSVHRVPIERRHSLKLTDKAEHMRGNRRIVNLSPKGRLVRHILTSAFSGVDGNVGAVHLRIRSMTRTTILVTGLFGHLYVHRVANGNSSQVRLFSSKHNLPNKVNFVRKRTCHTSYNTNGVSSSPFMTNEQVSSCRTSNLSP